MAAVGIISQESLDMWDLDYGDDPNNIIHTIASTIHSVSVLYQSLECYSKNTKDRSE